MSELVLFFLFVVLEIFYVSITQVIDGLFREYFYSFLKITKKKIKIDLEIQKILDILMIYTSTTYNQYFIQLFTLVQKNKLQQNCQIFTSDYAVVRKISISSLSYKTLYHYYENSNGQRGFVNTTKTILDFHFFLMNIQAINFLY